MQIKQEEKSTEFPPKIFRHRNSVLTDLWEGTCFDPIRSFYVSGLILLYIHAILLYFIDYDIFVSYLSITTWTFSKLHIITMIWFAMMGSILLILYPTYRFWAFSRFPLRKAGFYDFLFLTKFVVFQCALLIFPAIMIIHYEVPIMSSFIIVIEQIRLMMKCHAFVRETAAKILKCKPHRDDDEKDLIKICPDLDRFLYFLFAPTLVYKDSYPRTPHIRWKHVTKYFLQVLGCSLGGFIIYFTLIHDAFKNFGNDSQPLKSVVGVLTVSTLAGGMLLFLCFYVFLHCWLNAFAEILKFGDRMFYQDWWNSTPDTCVKTWNVVVHEWFYFYVYRDTYFFLGRNRCGATLLVAVVSGLMHDYVAGICLKSAFPLMFFALLISIAVKYITRKRKANAWKIFMWASLLQFWGAFVIYYPAEWFARKNCSRVLDSWLDVFVPRFFTFNYFQKTHSL